MTLIAPAAKAVITKRTFNRLTVSLALIAAAGFALTKPGLRLTSAFSAAHAVKAADIPALSSCPSNRTAGIVFTGSWQRLLDGFDLRTAGIIGALRISGADGIGLATPQDIASRLRLAMLAGGLLNVSQEVQSTDTHENAVNSARWLSGQLDICLAVLITSEKHMPRALYLLQEYAAQTGGLPPISGFAVQDSASYRVSDVLYEYFKAVATIGFGIERNPFKTRQTPLAPDELHP